MLDIFRSDAFGVVPLTIAINNLKFVPGYLSSTGIFSESSVATTAVSIEEKNNILALIAPTPRGGPGHTLPKIRRTMRMIAIPHFEINDAINADEVQGVRPFGQETGTEGVMTKVGERLQAAGQSLEYTQEHARIGAVKGVIVYADGSTTDIYAEYGLAVPTEVDMNLDAATADGSVRAACAAIIRTMGTALDGQPFSGITALCGDQFFDALIKNAEVRQTYLNYQAAADLRSPYVAAGQVWGQFEFGGILWVNYRGYALGVPMIETTKAYLFPTGVPDLFKTIYAPADYVETVNTMGKPRYSKQWEMANGKGIHMDTQMNALNWVTRPYALARAKLT